VPPSAKRTDFFSKEERFFSKEDRFFFWCFHKNTRKFIHTNSTISTRCGNFDTSGSTDGHSTGFGGYVVTLRLAANHWGRTQTPRIDFTTSVLAGSGSARHGTVCPPKPKILATPLATTTCWLYCLSIVTYH